MPRRFEHLPDHQREPHQVEWPGFWGVYLRFLGIALALGLLWGSSWLLWRFVKMVMAM